MPGAPKLGRMRGLRLFEVQFQCPLQICQSLFFNLALACDIHFDTLRYVTIALAPNGVAAYEQGAVPDHRVQDETLIGLGRVRPKCRGVTEAHFHRLRACIEAGYLRIQYEAEPLVGLDLERERVGGQIKIGRASCRGRVSLS